MKNEEKNKVKENTFYYCGEPVTKITPIDLNHCKKRYVIKCSLYNSPFYNKKEDAKKNNLRRKMIVFHFDRNKVQTVVSKVMLYVCVFVCFQIVIFSVIKYSRVKNDYNLFIKSLEENNYNQICGDSSHDKN